MLTGIDNRAFVRGNLFKREKVHSKYSKNQVKKKKLSNVLIVILNVFVFIKNLYRPFKRNSPNTARHFPATASNRIYLDPKIYSQLGETSHNQFNYSDFELGKSQDCFSDDTRADFSIIGSLFNYYL